MAAIIAAEAAVVGLYFTHLAQKALPVGIVCALLLGVLALVVAPFLCSLAIKSCKRAFLASMESTRLMTKCVWAMGLTAKVAVNEAVADIHQHAGDPYLYPTRWTLGPIFGSEADFLKERLNDPKNSYGLTRTTLIVICGAAIVQGVASMAAVLWNLFS
ncbi:hypothetical protein [uncultured Paludibaculum sp.]|uniref:hypothetical protein n=1 Tax=uncultured Paludibaculum sp. TaxID=1765020 RepID=UPI002AAB8D0B|nr:hypothetical protein [uncultured Paludibaculum sp.]